MAEKKYVSCVVVGHGHYAEIIRDSKSRTHMPQTYTDSTIQFNICTFAAPGETCMYPPYKAEQLKQTMITMARAPRDEPGGPFSSGSPFDKFKNIVIESQEAIDPIISRYRSDDWAPAFTPHPERTENWVIGNTYVDKRFSEETEYKESDGLESGIFILNNNVGLEIGTQISIADGIYLHDIINRLKTTYSINEFYMLDTTCNAQLGSRVVEKIARAVKSLNPQTFGGKLKKKRRTKKRSRKKRSKTLHKKRFRNFRRVYIEYAFSHQCNFFAEDNNPREYFYFWWKPLLY